MLRKFVVLVVMSAAFLVGLSSPAYACCCVPHDLCEVTGTC